MHGLGIAGNQGMPIRQVVAVREQPVCAALRQPVVSLFIAGRQYETVGNELGAIRVVSAATGLCIEQLAGEIRVEQLARILVFYLVHAAKRATVAQ